MSNDISYVRIETEVSDYRSGAKKKEEKSGEVLAVVKEQHFSITESDYHKQKVKYL